MGAVAAGALGGCAGMAPISPPSMTAPAPHTRVAIHDSTTERLTPSPAEAGTATLRGFSAYEKAALRIRNIGCGGVSSGSGFAISSSVLVTNQHVVQGATTLQVETYDGRSREVETAGVATYADLAVVFIRDELPAVLPLARRNPSTGSRVTVVGYPLGGRLTTSEGHVLRYGTDPMRSSAELMMANDAPIQPGSSGSPLVDDAGDVVGVAYAGKPGGPYWAVPVELLRSLSSGDRQLQRVTECE